MNFKIGDIVIVDNPHYDAYYRNKLLTIIDIFQYPQYQLGNGGQYGARLKELQDPRFGNCFELKDLRYATNIELAKHRIEYEP